MTRNFWANIGQMEGERCRVKLCFVKKFLKYLHMSIFCCTFAAAKVWPNSPIIQNTPNNQINQNILTKY